jgi:hypothetical protein
VLDSSSTAGKRGAVIGKDKTDGPVTGHIAHA